MIALLTLSLGTARTTRVAQAERTHERCYFLSEQTAGQFLHTHRLTHHSWFKIMLAPLLTAIPSTDWDNMYI